MDIFKEIEEFDWEAVVVDSKTKDESQKETIETLNIVEKDGLFYLEPQTTEEDILNPDPDLTTAFDEYEDLERMRKDYAYVGEKSTMYASGYAWAIGLKKTNNYNEYARGQKVAKYIKKAKKCSPKARERLRKKAIKLLKKGVETIDIEKAIREENFCDNLDIYMYVFEANRNAIKRAITRMPEFVNIGQIPKFVKYLKSSSVMGSEAYMFDFVNIAEHMTPKELKEFLIIRPSAVKEIVEATLKNMSEDQLKVCFEAGLGLSEKTVANLVEIRAKRVAEIKATFPKDAQNLEQKYGDILNKFYEAIQKYNTTEGHKQQQVKLTKKIQSKQKLSLTSEQVVDKLFKEAQENIEEQTEK